MAGGFLLLMALYGAIYTFPALDSAMAADLGSSRTALQGAFALWLLAVAICAPLTGHLVDRRGSRPVLFLGVGALIATLLGVAAAQATWHVYLALIFLGAPAHSLIQLGAVVAASRTGVQHRGSALGLAGAGMGAGLTLLVPAAVWLDGVAGWRAVFLALAALVALISLPAFPLLARAPVLRPMGAARPSRHSLGSRPFLLLFVGGVSIGLVDEAIYQHLVPHLQATGLTPGRAGAILGVASLAYMGGQLAGGIGSDHWGRWPTGLVAAVLLGVGLLAVTVRSGTGGDKVYTALGAGLCAGIGLGATIAVRSVVLADLFDGPSLGVVTGAYQWAYAVGGAAMGWAGAYAFARLGSYKTVFVAATVAAAVWAACLRGALATSRRPVPIEAGN